MQIAYPPAWNITEVFDWGYTCVRGSGWPVYRVSKTCLQTIPCHMTGMGLDIVFVIRMHSNQISFFSRRGTLDILMGNTSLD